MEKHNFAAYQPGSFATDVSNFTLGEKFFENKDIPAFVHEYCHYIQDITQISSIFGFSLLMRDISALTGVFSSGEKQTIKIPLQQDEFNEPVDKYRRYYNLYAGCTETLPLDYSKLSYKENNTTIEEIQLDGQPRKLAVNRITLNGHATPIHFGLIALQEIQAFYAQLLAEQKAGGIELSVYAKDLPQFPYHFGEFLFNEFGIRMSLELKFILTDLCLDTIQAPSVFLMVLKRLKNQKLENFGQSVKYFETLVQEENTKVSHSNEIALDNIMPDLEIWAKDPSRKYLSQALSWYIKQIKLTTGLKALEDKKTFFSLAFCMDWPNFALLFSSFAPPVYLKNGVLYRNVDANHDDSETDYEFIKDFEAATTIWSHRLLYNFLTSKNKKQLTERCECPLYENCQDKEKIGDEYTCKTAPWEIIKNEKKIICQYGMAAHSFGLWQNTLDIDWESPEDK